MVVFNSCMVINECNNLLYFRVLLQKIRNFNEIFYTLVVVMRVEIHSVKIGINMVLKY